MEHKEETGGKLIVYVFWLLCVCFFYIVSFGEAEEGFTRWSTGGETFSVARCPPCSTCTTCTRPVFDSLHYWTACSLIILTCCRRNSARLTFSKSVLNHWSAKLAKTAEVLVKFGGQFFLCWHHLLSVGGVGKADFVISHIQLNSFRLTQGPTELS